MRSRKAADVARGSFYNHFTDKESLALEIVEGIRTSLADEIRAANTGGVDPDMGIARGLCTVLLFGLKHCDRAGALTRLMPGTTSFDAPINLLAREHLQAGLAQGVFSEVNVEEGLVLVIGASMLMLHHALERKGPRLDPVAYSSALAGGLLRGLGTEFARARNTAASAARDVFSDFLRSGDRGSG